MHQTRPDEQGGGIARQGGSVPHRLIREQSPGQRLGENRGPHQQDRRQDPARAERAGDARISFRHPRPFRAGPCAPAGAGTGREDGRASDRRGSGGRRRAARLRRIRGSRAAARRDTWHDLRQGEGNGLIFPRPADRRLWLLASGAGARQAPAVCAWRTCSRLSLAPRHLVKEIMATTGRPMDMGWFYLFSSGWHIPAQTGPGWRPMGHEATAGGRATRGGTGRRGGRPAPGEGRAGRSPIPGNGSGPGIGRQDATTNAPSHRICCPET